MYRASRCVEQLRNLSKALDYIEKPDKTDGKMLVSSFDCSYEIGKQLADAVTKGQYEYVLTTHIDKGHVHNYIIFCAANFVDHHKYNSNKRSYCG